MLRPGRIYRRRRLLVGGAVLLLVGGAAYKVGQSQAQQIQQHTGKPPEDLSQDELEQAMDDLGIEGEDLTPQDQAAIEAEAVDAAGAPAEPAAAPPAASPPATPAAAPASDYIAELERLAGLRDKGIITVEEIEAKIEAVTGSVSGQA